jgi:hypothetical protein
MSKGLRVSLVPFSVSGTGAEAQSVELFGNPQSGRVRRIVLRQDAGGGATTGDLYLFTDNFEPTSSPSTDDQTKAVVVVSGVALTASASAVSLDTPISAEPAFKSTLTLVADVTAGAGAWTLVGYVEVES